MQASAALLQGRQLGCSFTRWHVRKALPTSLQAALQLQGTAGSSVAADRGEGNKSLPLEMELYLSAFCETPFAVHPLLCCMSGILELTGLRQEGSRPGLMP